MARESQGIQIALIIFVMLAIVLGVTTYLYVQRNGEVLKAQVDANGRAAAAETASRAKDVEIADLKKMILGTSDKATADIKATFDDDMKKFAANFPEDARVYSQIVARLAKTVESQDANFAKTISDLAALQAEFQARESRGNKMLKDTQGLFAGIKTDVEKQRTAYENEERERQDQQTVLVNQIKTIKTTSLAAVAAQTEIAAKYKAAGQEFAKEAHEANKTIVKLTTQKMDAPCGEITWVNQRSRTVWLNRGRADHLERQTKFGVYAGEGGNMSATKKADVEVVRVVDDHTAEARILAGDSISDPVMPGDKIYTPLWTPGQQMHFALAGIMDIDEDGHNAIATVRGLINSNGAVVDCEMDGDGNITGAITAATRIIVLGEAPGAKSPQKLIAAYGAMVGQAEAKSATKMTLAELKEKMGYKKSSSVEHFGSSAGQNDVAKTAAAVKAAPKKKPAENKDASGDNQ